MPPRRTTPLFDLLTRREPMATPAPASRPANEPRIPKPVVRVQLQPQAAPPDPESAEPSPRWQGQGQSVRMPVTWLYLTVAAAILLLVFAVAGGWKLGKIRADKDAEKFIRRDAPFVQEPAGADQSTGTSPIINSNQGNPQNTPAPSQPATGDPRQQGLNYLYLATLPRADAEAAVAFLNDNRVQAFAVPVPTVDTRGSGANNRGPGNSYRLGVLPGLTADQLKHTDRTNLESEVVRLGALWQKEHRGSSNFAKFEWRKFQ